jgi:hypothetical protein
VSGGWSVEQSLGLDPYIPPDDHVTAHYLQTAQDQAACTMAQPQPPEQDHQHPQPFRLVCSTVAFRMVAKAALTPVATITVHPNLPDTHILHRLLRLSPMLECFPPHNTGIPLAVLHSSITILQEARLSFKTNRLCNRRVDCVTSPYASDPAKKTSRGCNRPLATPSAFVGCVSGLLIRP